MSSCTDRFVLRCRHALLREVVRLTERPPSHEAQALAFHLRRAVASIPSQLGDGTTAASGALADRAVATTTEATEVLKVMAEHGLVAAQESEHALFKLSAIRNMAALAKRRAARPAVHQRFPSSNCSSTPSHPVTQPALQPTF